MLRAAVIDERLNHVDIEATKLKPDAFREESSMTGSIPGVPWLRLRILLTRIGLELCLWWHRA